MPALIASSTPTRAHSDRSIRRSLTAAYCSMVPCRSMWSGLRLSSTPIVGARLGARSIWIGRDFEDVQPAGFGGSRASTAVPMLPPICTSQPAEPKRCAVSAVVVDLPFVPVMATSGASGAIAARSRQKSSMSPMISTPAAVASFADQCGSGWVSGTPGVSTRDAISDQSMPRSSATSCPAARALSRAARHRPTRTRVLPRPSRPRRSQGRNRRARTGPACVPCNA